MRSYRGLSSLFIKVGALLLVSIVGPAQAQELPSTPEGFKKMQWATVRRPFYTKAMYVNLQTHDEETYTGLLLGIYGDSLAFLPGQAFPMVSADALEAKVLGIDEILTVKFYKPTNALRPTMVGGLVGGTVGMGVFYAIGGWFIGLYALPPGFGLGFIPGAALGALRLAFDKEAPTYVMGAMDDKALRRFARIEKKNRLVPNPEDLSRLPSMAPANPADPETWYTLYPAIPVLKRVVPNINTYFTFTVASPKSAIPMSQRDWLNPPAGEGNVYTSAFYPMQVGFQFALHQKLLSTWGVSVLYQVVPEDYADVGVETSGVQQGIPNGYQLNHTMGQHGFYGMIEKYLLPHSPSLSNRWEAVLSGGMGIKFGQSDLRTWRNGNDYVFTHFPENYSRLSLMGEVALNYWITTRWALRASGQGNWARPFTHSDFTLPANNPFNDPIDLAGYEIPLWNTSLNIGLVIGL